MKEQILNTLKTFPYGATMQQVEAITCIPETESLLKSLYESREILFDGHLYFPL